LWLPILLGHESAQRGQVHKPVAINLTAVNEAAAREARDVVWARPTVRAASRERTYSASLIGRVMGVMRRRDCGICSRVVQVL
jgi:hypothetical protein